MAPCSWSPVWTHPHPALRAAQEASRAGGPDSDADGGVLELDVSGEADLNKATEVELRLAKQRMEQDFVRNQVRPGHPAYEYDKQVGAFWEGGGSR